MDGKRRFDNFLTLEDELDVANLRVNGIQIWDYIRLRVYREIRQKQGLNPMHDNLSIGPIEYIRGGVNFTKNLINKNPFLSGSPDIMIFGSGRRKMKNGQWVDIFTDPITDELEFDHSSYELPHRLKHYKPAATKNLYYLDLIKYGGTLQRLLGLGHSSITHSEIDEIRVIADYIRSKFGVEIDVAEIITESLIKRNTEIWMYERLLKKVQPSIIILVCSYGRESLIETCQKLNLPVMELQHGAIHPGHPGYDFPRQYKKRYFPNYIMVWGDFWRCNADMPISKDNIFVTGYEWLETKINTPRNISRKKQIVFLSQGVGGRDLSLLARDCASSDTFHYDVIYKLHPSECEDWKHRYPWLLDSGVEILDDPSEDLHNLLAESTAQVGVRTTAIYEGLMYDLDTYVLNHPEAYILEPLVRKNVATQINTVEDIGKNLNSEPHSFNKSDFFTSNARLKTTSHINRIVRQYH